MLAHPGCASSLWPVLRKEDVLCNIVDCALDSIRAAFQVEDALAPPFASSLGVASYPVRQWRTYAYI